MREPQPPPLLRIGGDLFVYNILSIKYGAADLRTLARWINKIADYNAAMERFRKACQRRKVK